MDKILIFILKRAAIFFSLFTFFSASIAKAQEPSPELAWIKIFDIGPYSFAFDVAVDTQGFAIVAGSAFFPEKSWPRGWDARVIKLTPDGNVAWDKTFDSGNYDHATGIDTDSFGNIYTVGPSSYFEPLGCRVLKWDSDGNILWNTVVSSASLRVFCHSIAVDNAGHAYAVGEIAEGFLPSDVYLFKLNSAGVLEWQQRIDEGTITTYKGGKLHVETFAMDAAVDAQGDLVLAGSHFQQEPLFTYQSLREFMTAKFSPTGLLKFKQFFKADIVPFKAGISSERGFATGVSIDPNDNIMTGGGEWVSSDKSTGFLQRGFLYGKLSPEGIPFIKQVHSVRGFTGSSGSDASGNFYLPGAPDRLDIAISKVGADGTLLWSTTTLRGLSNAEATGADVDQEGNVYVAGDLVPTQPSAGSKIVVLKYRQAVAPKATLSIRLEPEEVFPGGQTQITIHALDTSNNPVSDLDITLTAEAVAFSGGHDHNVNRPMGTFSGSGIMYSSPAHGKTGPDGKLFAVFTSTHFGGFETIQAHVTDTPAVSTSAALNVRVPGLEPMPPSSRYNLTGSSGLVSGNVRCAGEPIRHSQNHFGTQRTIATLESIILEYEDFLFDLNAVSLPIPGPIAIHKLGINNMSLPYGGLFDICSDWNPPYDGYHHAGTSVDIDPRGEILERPGEMMAIYPPALEDIIATRFVGVKRKKEKEAEFHYEFLP